MIGISVANKDEWLATLKYFEVKDKECKISPYGEYFERKINNKNCVIFFTGTRKTQSAGATQYFIDKFSLEKILVTGTCAGIDPALSTLDIIVPSKIVQYDCAIEEIEPFIKERLSVYVNLSKYGLENNSYIVGTGDRPVVMWKDYLKLKENGITIADTESAAIALVCKANNVESVVIRGISDFPNEKIETNLQETFERQLANFTKNLPLVMQKIFSEYIDKFI